MVFTYMQLQKCYVYLKKFIGKKFHNFEMTEESDYYQVEDEAKKHSQDSPILKYEDIMDIPFITDGDEFEFNIKIYSKKAVGFVVFIKYDIDQYNSEDQSIHEKFSKTNYVWDDGVSGYQLMEYIPPTDQEKLKDAEVVTMFEESLKEVMNEIENILK